MRFFLLFLFSVAAGFQGLQAHVGSPGVVMQGAAGSYNLLVSVTPPDVIPGIAVVTVYVQKGDVSSVLFRAVDFRSGGEGAPSPDRMKPVAGQTGQYTGSVWLMTTGSASIQLDVEGNEGRGQLIVPVVGISTAVNKMPYSTGLLLACLGIFLFILMLTIAGASASTALVKPGEELSNSRKKLRLYGMGFAALLFSLIVYGGNRWWQSSANDYYKYMFKPQRATATVRTANGRSELFLSLDTTSDRRQNFSFIVSDHGKLMHLFIMRIPMMDAFAHLHPVREDSVTYRTILPKLPKGKYLLFADLVYNTGFTETLKDTFNVAEDLTDSPASLDKDDAYVFARPTDSGAYAPSRNPADIVVCGKAETGVRLRDSSVMSWVNMSNRGYESGKLYQLTFAVFAPDKNPAVLQPYLGMQGHAAIVRNDGGVYIHLHPVGTFSMASEINLRNRIAAPRGIYHYPNPAYFRDSIDKYLQQLNSLSEQDREKVLMTGMNMRADNASSGAMKHDNMVTFPYAFPKPGRYRIWVQVKRHGKILTGVFDKLVN